MAKAHDISVVYKANGKEFTKAALEVASKMDVLKHEAKRFKEEMAESWNFSKIFKEKVSGGGAFLAKNFGAGAIAGLGFSMATNLVDSLGGALKNLTVEQWGVVDKLDETAEMLGINTESLTRLHHAASLGGVGADEFNSAIRKMQVNLSKTATEGGDLENTFKMLGLSAQDLASMTADQAFTRISQGISEIKNPAQQAAVAVEIFGKSGASMLGMLRGGEGSLAALGKEADKLGLTVSTIDASAVASANDALQRVWEVAQGLGRTLATELAPYVIGFADSFTTWATSGEGVKSTVGGALEYIGGWTITLADYFHLAANVSVLVYDGLYGIARVSLMCVGAFEALANAIAGVFGQGWESNTDQMIAQLDKFTMKVNEATLGQDKSYGEQIAQTAAQFKTKGIKAARDATADRDKVGKINLEAQRLKEQQEKEKKASEDRLKAWKKEQEDKQKSLDDTAKKIIESNRTPLEKFKEEMDKANEAFQTGRLTEDQFSREKSRLKKELNKEIPKAGATTEALQFGSSAAFEFLASRGQKKEKSADDIVKVLEKIYKVTAEQNNKNAKEVEQVFEML